MIEKRNTKNILRVSHLIKIYFIVYSS